MLQKIKVILLLTFVCLIAENKGQSVYPISPQVISGEVGTEFIVDVAAKDVSNLFGVSFNMKFDSQIFEVVSVNKGDFLGSDVVFFQNTDNSQGILSVGMSRKSGQGNVNGKGKLVSVKLKVKASSSNTSSQKEKTDESADNQNTAKEDTASKIYDNNIEGKHKFVFVIPQKGVDKKQFLDNIKNFNNSNYADLKIEIKESSLDNIRQLITLSGFDDKESAMRYFKTIVQNRDLYKPLGKASYRNFLISDKNYKIFLQDKNIKSYIDFYKQTYL